MKIMDKLKVKLKGREEAVRKKAAVALYTGYKASKGKLIDPQYNRLWEECDKVLDGNMDWKTHKYWEDTVLGKYFGKYVKGELKDEAKFLKKWLEEFIWRLRSQKVKDSDRMMIRERFIPFMKDVQNQGDFKALLQFYKLNP